MLKKILLVITSPIWWPWKVLFFRKEGDKFKDVNDKEKTIRLVTSPIVKPLKFCLYIFILLFEIMIIYKVRFSPLTLPITRGTVHKHYLAPNSLVVENPASKDALTRAFDYIDAWDTDAKNKMYVIFDAEIVKWAFEYSSYDTSNYILDKFNTDEQFRNDIHEAVSDIQTNFSRAIRELPSILSHDEFDFILDPFATLGGVVMDYRAVLDLANSMGDTATQKYNLSVHGAEFDHEDIDHVLSMIIDFSKGTSLREAIDNNLH